jgi:hypothetical protein
MFPHPKPPAELLSSIVGERNSLRASPNRTSFESCSVLLARYVGVCEQRCLASCGAATQEFVFYSFLARSPAGLALSLGLASLLRLSSIRSLHFIACQCGHSIQAASFGAISFTFFLFSSSRLIGSFKKSYDLQ